MRSDLGSTGGCDEIATPVAPYGRGRLAMTGVGGAAGGVAGLLRPLRGLAMTAVGASQ